MSSINNELGFGVKAGPYFFSQWNLLMNANF